MTREEKGEWRERIKGILRGFTPSAMESDDFWFREIWSDHSGLRVEIFIPREDDAPHVDFPGKLMPASPHWHIMGKAAVGLTATELRRTLRAVTHV